MNHHKLRIKEPVTKLPKHLDKETFLAAVNRGEIPIKIPNMANAPDEYLKNFNGIAKYCNFRGNISYKNPDLFTWTLKQQQFNPIEIPKAFLSKNKRSNQPPKNMKIKTEINYNNNEDDDNNNKLFPIQTKENNKNLNILNPPKRKKAFQARSYSEKQLKKFEKEEMEYEEKIQILLKTKWEDIIKNANYLKHRKIFSITKMQNDALNDDKNSSYYDTMMESSGMSKLSQQRNHFLNPFDKKNFGINKIIHYINEKDDNDDGETRNFLNQTNRSKTCRRKPSIPKLQVIKDKKFEDLQYETTLIHSSRNKYQRSKSYMLDFENKLENAAKIKLETINPRNSIKNLKNSHITTNEDNILNYNSYFSKRYFNTGFRLELSEKGKNLVKNFENNLKKSIEKFDIQLNENDIA